MDFVNIQQVIDSLASWEPWVVILIVIGSGAIGGWAQKYSVGIPAKGPTKLPFLGYIVVGIAAALGVMFVLTSEPLLRLISFSIVAGFGGKAVLSAMEERLIATEAQTKVKEAADSLETSAKSISKVQQGIEEKANGKPAEELAPELENMTKETEKLRVQATTLRAAFR